MNKYLCGMATGMIVGASIGMMVFPQLDRKTQRKMKNAGNKVIDMATDSCHNVMMCGRMK
ncbi:YtxH domain-containing protein [Clostridium sp. MSJ-8]|uniref:YtxH domain-containing protein n=1 Tax=Clostridium sp. MSJ-8 TaxID=2841510 RepID=UPI00209F4448|nr:YtxH domain-containing protein [Clostridium sp. MSJ-8]